MTKKTTAEKLALIKKTQLLLTGSALVTLSSETGPDDAKWVAASAPAFWDKGWNETSSTTCSAASPDEAVDELLRTVYRRVQVEGFDWQRSSGAAYATSTREKIAASIRELEAAVVG